MKISYEDIRRMRLVESQILDGRKTKAGNFFLEKLTLTSINPVSGVKTYSTSLEMAQPVVSVLKGDEKEVISGGMGVSAGDLVCTFSQTKYLPRTEPSSTGSFYYDRVQYDPGGSPGNTSYYQILSVSAKGLGDIPNRQTLYATKEK